MKVLIEKIKEISTKYEQLSALSGNNFNVFNVINVTTDEVRLHSKFIAEFLNPNGSHGQGDVFLKIFVDSIGVDMNTISAEVNVELYIGEKTQTSGGFIDIFIDDKRSKTITIENKIYAPDQDNQLLRYYNFNKNNLFYLTLFGEEPSKKSIVDDKGKELQLETDFKCISYKEDIRNWLIACRKEAVQFPLLREGISHYINLIESLTGKTNNEVMNKEITKFLMSSEDNLKQATLIEENINNVKIEIQWKFWEALKLSLEQKLSFLNSEFEELKLIPKLSVTKENVVSYYSKRNRDKYYGFWIKIFDQKDVTIHFGIDLEDEIYFGFTLERNGEGGTALNEENKEFRNMALNIHHNYKSSQYWIAYRFTDYKLNFRAFNSKNIFALADDKKLKESVDKMSETMITDILKFKQKLKNI